ncbi:MAG TPA: hypothetical protein VLG50_03985 [Candidatus Saccharimonadales bacterium]|nr:hypothetical protein [Candidatus Saccharimonadales bacterium]
MIIDQNLFFSILIGFALFYLALGVWSARSVRTLQNYFLANRNLGVFKLTFALIASQLGSGMILGTAYRAYHVGLWGLLYAIGMSLGFIILGCGLASRMRALNVNTTAEIFETIYGSYYLKLFASLLSIVSLWGILLAQIVASKSLFFGLKITDPYVLVSCWVFLIFYSMLGGLHSIVIVDIAQVLFISSIFLFAFFSLPSATETMTNLPRLTLIQNYFYNVKPDLWSFLPILFIPTLFALIEQDLAQKFFAAKTRATATISAFLAGLFLIAFSIIPIFFGILAKIKHAVIPQGGNPLVASLFLVSSKMVFILAICGIMAAITSTASSLLCAISSNIVQDFSAFLPLKNHKLTTTRVISFLIGISALVMSFYTSNDILFILENSYRVSVICLFVPTVIAYFAKSLYKQAAWVSVLCGVAGLIGVQFYPMTSIMKDIVPLALSLSSYICMYFIVWIKKQLSL